MPHSSNISHLLADAWKVASAEAIESLGTAGGFSGAEFWRIRTHSGVLCLRRWPTEHPDRRRLEWIHRVLLHAQKSGVDFLPVPRPTVDAQTFVEREGSRWELAPWLPGQADFHQHPSDERLCAALAALAEFHVAVERATPDGPRVDVPPAIGARCNRLDVLLAGGLERIQRQIRPGDWPELALRGDQIVEHATGWNSQWRQQLERLRNERVPVQPVIRDIWHDHVLFSADRVTGMVDFGAMRIDTVATDIARLIGSLVGDDVDAVGTAISAYTSIRPLSATETALIAPLDRSGTIIGALNWLDWIYCQGRRFNDREAILERLDTAIARISTW